MAQVQELKTVVKETLENRGVLGEVKARVRAEVFHALNDPLQKRPQLSNENLLLNELIREYLEFNQYKYTSSVLLTESGQPTTPLDRQFLAEELNIAEDRHSASIPLLYGILAHFLQGKGKGMSIQAGQHPPIPNLFKSLPVRTNSRPTSKQDLPSHSDVRVGEPFTIHSTGR
ncbi:centrosomal protein 20-like [Diadema antillarum]|uniref:centrosomal protein 20-like n=2 Tax=Diadema antillarum TaxID=105358 RepID=UPI003A859879